MIKDLKEKRTQDKPSKSSPENAENKENKEEQNNSGNETSGYFNSSSYTPFSATTDTVIPGLDLVNEDGNTVRDTRPTGVINNPSSESVTNGDVYHKLSETAGDTEGEKMEVNNDTGKNNGVTDEQSVPNIAGKDVKGGVVGGVGENGETANNAPNDSVDSVKDSSVPTDDLDPRNFIPKVELDAAVKKDGEISSSENPDASAESEVDNIDDRLASFAKASEMLHSIAKMAQADSELNTEDDFKSDSDHETEVCVTRRLDSI